MLCYVYVWQFMAPSLPKILFLETQQCVRLGRADAGRARRTPQQISLPNTLNRLNIK